LPVGIANNALSILFGAVMELSETQQQFNAAMARYHTGIAYQAVGWLVATVVIGLQGLLLLRVWQLPIGLWQLPVLLVAWLLTDFVNGLVHMVMDNASGYRGLFGPLVANFHLHHRIPQYRRRPLPVVYFLESGSKIWLAVALALLVWGWPLLQARPLFAWLLVYVGILSSLAEVSHYLCHSSMAPLGRWLGDCGILLGKRHHARHHLHNNVSYAFLNGLTDPLIDPIARRLYPGYKLSTDLHFAAYIPPDETSR
jgi:hypothetical protein